MSGRHKELRKRLKMVEESLGKTSQCTETPLYLQVGLEAQREISPEDLALFKSGEAARGEGRFHSLEEHAVMNRFQELRDVVARRYGFQSYGGVLRQYIESQPQTRPSAKQSEELVKILNWGRLNCAHLEKLRRALEASKSNSSVSVIALDPASGMASSTPSHHSNL
jgi:hypothetical protein